MREERGVGPEGDASDASGADFPFPCCVHEVRRGLKGLTKTGGGRRSVGLRLAEKKGEVCQGLKGMGNLMCVSC